MCATSLVTLTTPHNRAGDLASCVGNKPELYNRIIGLLLLIVMSSAVLALASKPSLAVSVVTEEIIIGYEKTPDKKFAGVRISSFKYKWTEEEVKALERLKEIVVAAKDEAGRIVRGIFDAIFGDDLHLLEVEPGSSPVDISSFYDVEIVDLSEHFFFGESCDEEGPCQGLLLTPNEDILSIDNFPGGDIITGDIEFRFLFAELTPAINITVESTAFGENGQTKTAEISIAVTEPSTIIVVLVGLLGVWGCVAWTSNVSRNGKGGAPIV